MCLEIYELDRAKFLSVPGLAWQAALKKTKVKLDFLTVTDMFLMVEGEGELGEEGVTLFFLCKKANKK